MKKSVVVFLLFILLCVPVFAMKTVYQRSIGTSWTGAQALDLPPPPPPPGGDTTEITPTTPPPTESTPTPPPPPIPPSTSEASDILSSTAEASQNAAAIDERVTLLEQQMKAVDLLPKFEERLNSAEQKAAAASTVVERLDAMQSQVDAVKVDVENVRTLAGRPYVDSPTFDAALGNLEGSTRTKAILSISLAAIALIMVIVLLAMAIVQSKRADQQNKHAVVQFLKNYRQQGYPLESLKMHLAACGWPDEVVSEAVKQVSESL